jgi:hypothetical protein
VHVVCLEINSLHDQLHRMITLHRALKNPHCYIRSISALQLLSMHLVERGTEHGRSRPRSCGTMPTPIHKQKCVNTAPFINVAMIDFTFVFFV